MNIYVSKLSFDTTSESLKELFAEYGETTSANVILDKVTGVPRGFGFVEMANENDGRKAIEKLNDTEFEGKNVCVARPKNDKNTGFRKNRSGGDFNRRQF